MTAAPPPNFSPFGVAEEVVVDARAEVVRALDARQDVAEEDEVDAVVRVEAERRDGRRRCRSSVLGLDEPVVGRLQRAEPALLAYGSPLAQPKPNCRCELVLDRAELGLRREAELLDVEPGCSGCALTAGEVADLALDGDDLGLEAELAPEGLHPEVGDDGPGVRAARGRCWRAVSCRVRVDRERRLRAVRRRGTASGRSCRAPPLITRSPRASLRRWSSGFVRWATNGDPLVRRCRGCTCCTAARRRRRRALAFVGPVDGKSHAPPK